MLVFFLFCFLWGGGGVLLLLVVVSLLYLKCVWCSRTQYPIKTVSFWFFLIIVNCAQIFDFVLTVQLSANGFAFKTIYSN